MLSTNYKNLAYFLIVIILFIKSWNYFLFYRLPYVEHFSGGKRLLPVEGRLRVLTLNVFLRPPMVSHHHSDFKDERTHLITTIFPYFDVILLQEVHTCLNFRCNHLITEASRHGLRYHYCNHGPSILSRYLSNNGLLILSRYPIESSDCVAFDQCASYDTIIEKGCNYIKVNVFPNLPVHIFNTHLQSSYQKNDRICENVRRCQLKQLEKFMKSKCDLHHDAIICGGDFNINSRNTTEYKLLNKILNPLTDILEGSDESSIRIAYDEKGNENNQICTVCKKCQVNIKNGLTEDQRLDYIFYNKNNTRLKYKHSKILPLRINRPDIDFTSLSDHSGLYAEFQY